VKGGLWRGDAHKITLIPPDSKKGKWSDDIEWKTELTKLGQAEAQKSIQGLRDVLKAGVMYDLLEAKLETVLLLPDGSKGIPKDMPRRLMDILIPYAKEVTKYARYDSAYIQQVKAMKAKQPNIPLPVNLYDISDEGMLQLFKGLVDDLDSLNPAPALVRPIIFPVLWSSSALTSCPSLTARVNAPGRITSVKNPRSTLSEL